MRRCVVISVDEGHRECLVAAAHARSWHIERKIEVARSGARGALDELKESARRGVVDAAVLERVQWPGEGVVGALRRLGELARLGVEVVSVGEPWLDVEAHSQLLHWLVGRFEQEHRSRIRAALSAVRATGRPLGRPRALIPTERVLALRAGGASIRSIAHEVGLGISTIQRFLASQRQERRNGK